MDTLSMLVDTALSIEKIRVSMQVRAAHLARSGRSDDETNRLIAMLSDLERYVDDRVATHIKAHPAYPWFSRVKGVGGENIAKVVGQIDIRKADTVSSLWKFAGYGVDNGKAPRRQPGTKLHYNSTLRVMCWRLGGNLMKARGKFYEYYLAQKDAYVKKYESMGWKIVDAASLSKKDGKRYEPDGVISSGHVHNMALRKMIKIFLACLWVEWRTAEGLPITAPYAIEHLGHHSLITPESMTDR